MAGLLDFIDAGPQRRQWLDDTVGDFMTYITPPNLRPAVEMVAQMNPVQGMGDSMQQFGVATDPSRSMDDRRKAAINTVVEGLLAATPAALAAKGYMTPAQGTMEGLLGWSPATQQIGDDLGRFVVDEAGNIRVWHGSPHDFDRFSMDKIGTGEGAQAYGHGLYFAESPDVARGYREALSAWSPDHISNNLKKKGVSDEASEAFSDFAAQTGGVSGSVDSFAETMSKPGATPSIEEYRARVRAEIPKMREALSGRPGHLYEVNIDANPEDFLDWDAPLTEQSRRVQDAFASIDPDMYSPAGGDYDPDELGQIMMGRLADAYRKTGTVGSVGDMARKELAYDYGIPGISYLDAGSRGAGDGTRNYVVFDDSLLSILSKDGQPTRGLLD